ncbi:hypothetical protein H6F74_28160 [Trichocoleus sp. FACHB-90]|uniref:hypothetical protein n=1 Tax=Cyanophyceae TaxID=3028117 RepID=UPI001683E3AA|nr:hypothetical protein [Trichocoleus sp. FACHB-90]MBD1930069.1 hypothetical protein [Trichocoleus sp. FACHB-90]
MLEQLPDRVCSVLSKYPQWEKNVEQALTKSPFDLDYSASVIEIFDQQGLLGGIAWGICYETQRLKEHPSEFIAWYLDWELGLFYVDSEVVLNRLILMSASSAILSCL